MKTLAEGVYEGDAKPVALFAEHLASNGELGLGMELWPHTTTADMVDWYISNVKGQKALTAWSKENSDDLCD